MKTLILLIGLAIIAGVVSFTVIDYRMQYVNDQEQAAAMTKAKEDNAMTSQLNVARADRGVLVEKHNALRAECLKGADAYAKLSLATRKLMAAPICGEDVK